VTSAQRYWPTLAERPSEESPSEYLGLFQTQKAPLVDSSTAELFSFGLPDTAYFAGAAGLAVVAAAGVEVFFTLECLTFFTGFLEATAGVEGVVGFAGVVAAGGFWAANIEVAAMARVNRVVFMAFFSL